jgi:hypothetical protein
MDESAKFELEQKVDLYKFYLSSYLKGIAFFLAIIGALLKFSVDSVAYRGVFSAAGVICCAIVLVPILYGISHERKFRRDFVRLAELTNTKPVSTSPFRMLIVTTASFWVIVSAGWLYVYLCLK